MAAKSDYLEDALLNHVLRNTAMASPAAVYLGLYSAAPTDAGGGTELSGNGYARQVVAFGAPGSGACQNTGTITFTANGGNWANATHWGLFDAAGGGNLLYWDAMTAAKQIDDGESIDFPPGNISIGED